MQLVSKISNVCDPDPPTSQTDGRTDRQTDGRTEDMQSQYRALHYCASRGKTIIITGYFLVAGTALSMQHIAGQSPVRAIRIRLRHLCGLGTGLNNSLAPPDECK